MAFALAEHFQKTSRAKEAAAIFEKLANARQSAWRLPARIRLAEAAYRDGRLEDCLARCGELLGETGAEGQRGAVLELMGRAYEQLGDHRKAARCFAGLAPD
jgi:hypothetical protein